MKPTKAKKIKIINEKTMIAALDIGKTAHYAYLRAPNGKDTKPFHFYNFRKLIIWKTSQSGIIKSPKKTNSDNK